MRILAICHIVIGVQFLSPAILEGRSWMAEDSIARKRISPFADMPGRQYLREKEEARPVQYSPDGRYFFYITYWGELAVDAVIGEITVFSTEEVVSTLSLHHASNKRCKSYRKLRMQSTLSTANPIDRPIWASDGSAIVFVGAKLNDTTSQIYRWELGANKLIKLTEVEGPQYGLLGIRNFAFQEEGLVYVHASRRPTGDIEYPGRLLKSRDSQSIVPATIHVVNDFYVSYGKKRPHRILPVKAQQVNGPNGKSLDRQPSAELREISFARNGRFVAFLNDSFERTDGRLIAQETRFVLFDLKDGRELAIPWKGIVDSTYQKTRDYTIYTRWKQRPPVGRAFWAFDNRRVVFSGIVRSREDVSNYASIGDSSLVLVLYDAITGTSKTLAKMIEKFGDSGIRDRYVTEIGWLNEGKDLLVAYSIAGKRVDGTLYTFTEKGLEIKSVGPEIRIALEKAEARQEGLSVTLRSSLNEPPQIVASDGLKEMSLSEVDPALVGVRIAPVKAFSWSGENGETYTGGLILPIASNQNQRVPLVILPYYFRSNEFLPDGPHSPPDCAQLLAARGIAVLQMDARWPGQLNVDGSENSLDLFMKRWEGAARQLAFDGVVDINRIGMIGFSWGGHQTLYAISHPDRVPLAAAVAVDFFTDTFWEYILRAGSESGYLSVPLGPGRRLERNRGGPFWDNKQKWLEEDPIFNIDRIRTPLLISYHGKSGFDGGMNSWDSPYVKHLVGAFRVCDKVIEYLYLPKADHIPKRPKEQLLLYNTVGDWLVFWLLNGKFPNIGKKE